MTAQFLAALALVGLVACTGTREPSLPTLLIVGYGGEVAPRVALVADSYPVEGPGERLEFLEETVRELPAAPVDLEVAGRGLGSDTLVVLARAGAGQAWLQRFDLSALDPLDPSGFVELGEPLDIAALLPEEDVPGVCPTRVEADSDLRYVAILSVPGVCGVSEPPEIYVLDLVAEELVWAVNRDFVGTIDELVPSGIEIASGADELLVFAAEGIAATLVYALPLDPEAEPELVGRAPERLDRDLELVGDSVALLGPSTYALVPLADPGEEEVAAVATVSSAGQFARDPVSTLEEVVVLADEVAAVHRDPLSDERVVIELEREAVDGALEPVQRFAYVLHEGAITVLDLWPYEALPGEEPAPRDLELFVPIPELEDAAVITWAYATAVEPEGELSGASAPR